MPILGSACGSEQDISIPNIPWNDRCCCPGIKCCIPLSITVTGKNWYGTSIGDGFYPHGVLEQKWTRFPTDPPFFCLSQNEELTSVLSDNGFHMSVDPLIGAHYNCGPDDQASWNSIFPFIYNTECLISNGISTLSWWPRIENRNWSCTGESACFPPPEDCMNVLLNEPAPIWDGCLDEQKDEYVSLFCSPPNVGSSYSINIGLSDVRLKGNSDLDGINSCPTQGDRDISKIFNISVIPAKEWHRTEFGQFIKFDEDRNAIVQAWKDRESIYPELGYTITRSKSPSPNAKEGLISYEVFPKRWTRAFFTNDPSPIIVMNLISEDLDGDNNPDTPVSSYLNTLGLNYTTGFVVDQKCGPRNRPDGREFAQDPYFQSLWCEADTNVAKPKLAPVIDSSTEGSGAILSLDLQPNLFTSIHYTLPGQLTKTAGVRGDDCACGEKNIYWCHDELICAPDIIGLEAIGIRHGIPNDHGTKYIWPNGWKVDTIQIINPGSGYQVGEYIKFKYFENPARGGEAIMRPICYSTGRNFIQIGPVCRDPEPGVDLGSCCDTFFDQNLGVSHAVFWKDQDGYEGEFLPGVLLNKVFFQRAKIMEVDENGGIQQIKILPLTRTQYSSIENMLIDEEMPFNQKDKYFVSYGRILCHSKSVFAGGTEYSEGDQIEWFCKPPPNGLVKNQKNNQFYEINADPTNACKQTKQAKGIIVDVDEYGSIQEWYIRGSDAWISNSFYAGPEVTIGQKLNPYFGQGDIPCGLLNYNCNETTAPGIGFVCQSNINPTTISGEITCPENYFLVKTVEDEYVCTKTIDAHSNYQNCIEQCEDGNCIPAIINITSTKCVPYNDPTAIDNILHRDGDIYDERGRYVREGYSLCDMRWSGSYPIRSSTLGGGAYSASPNIGPDGQPYGMPCGEHEQTNIAIYETLAALSVNIGFLSWSFDLNLRELDDINNLISIIVDNNTSLANELLMMLFPLYPKRGAFSVAEAVANVTNGGNNSFIGGSISSVDVIIGGAGYAYDETIHVEPILPTNLDTYKNVDRQPNGVGGKILSYEFKKHSNYPGSNRTYWTAPNFNENSDKYAWFSVLSVTMDPNDRGSGYQVLDVNEAIDYDFEIYPEEAIPNNLNLSTNDNCPNGTYYEDVWARPANTQQGQYSWTVERTGLESILNIPYIKARNSKCRLKITEVDQNGGIISLEVMSLMYFDDTIFYENTQDPIEDGGLFYRTIKAGFKRTYPDLYCFIGSTIGYGAILEANVNLNNNANGEILSIDVIQDLNTVDPLDPSLPMPRGGRDYVITEEGDILWEFDGNFGPGQLLAKWCKENEALYFQPTKSLYRYEDGSLPMFIPYSTLISTSGCPHDLIPSTTKNYPLYVAIGSSRWHVTNYSEGGCSGKGWFPSVAPQPRLYNKPNLPTSECTLQESTEFLVQTKWTPLASFGVADAWLALKSREKIALINNDKYFDYKGILYGMSMDITGSIDCNPMIEYNAGVP